MTSLEVCEPVLTQSDRCDSPDCCCVRQHTQLGAGPHIVCSMLSRAVLDWPQSNCDLSRSECTDGCLEVAERVGARVFAKSRQPWHPSWAAASVLSHIVVLAASIISIWLLVGVAAAVARLSFRRRSRTNALGRCGLAICRIIIGIGLGDATRATRGPTLGLLLQLQWHLRLQQSSATLTVSESGQLLR